jgi:hypothetical protein
MEPAQLKEELIDRPFGREKQLEQHAKSGRHDEVRHIHNGFEETGSLDFETSVREPDRQSQRDDDLRDKAKNKNAKRVDQEIPDIRHKAASQGLIEQIKGVLLTVGENVLIVGPTTKFGADKVKGDAGIVIVLERIDECLNQRDQLENEKGRKKRNQENPSPKIIGDVLLFPFHEKIPEFHFGILRKAWKEF